MGQPAIKALNIISRGNYIESLEISVNLYPDVFTSLGTLKRHRILHSTYTGHKVTCDDCLIKSHSPIITVPKMKQELIRMENIGLRNCQTELTTLQSGVQV